MPLYILKYYPSIIQQFTTNTLIILCHIPYKYAFMCISATKKNVSTNYSIGCLSPWLLNESLNFPRYLKYQHQNSVTLLLIAEKGLQSSKPAAKRVVRANVWPCYKFYYSSNSVPNAIEVTSTLAFPKTELHCDTELFIISLHKIQRHLLY